MWKFIYSHISSILELTVIVFAKACNFTQSNFTKSKTPPLGVFHVFLICANGAKSLKPSNGSPQSKLTWYLKLKIDKVSWNISDNEKILSNCN